MAQFRVHAVISTAGRVRNNPTDRSWVNDAWKRILRADATTLTNPPAADPTSLTRGCKGRK